MDDCRNVAILRAKVLLNRLGRLSVDSRFAHQASGVRGGLLRILSRSEAALEESDVEKLLQYINLGDEILRKAAAEIPES